MTDDNGWSVTTLDFRRFEEHNAVDREGGPLDPGPHSHGRLSHQELARPAHQSREAGLLGSPPRAWRNDPSATRASILSGWRSKATAQSARSALRI